MCQNPRDMSTNDLEWVTQYTSKLDVCKMKVFDWSYVYCQEIDIDIGNIVHSYFFVSSEL